MRKRGESGFALLLVFLMAAVIAITLYMQIPRVAMQAQRQKEQLLIERGEQYQRAIQLFFRTNNRYPGELKDLENFNNRRFLRHKFIDPMTGKDDWRIIHINNGVLTDSLLNKKKPGDSKQQDAAAATSYVGVQPSIGSQLTPAQQAGNPALSRRRQSDGGAPPAIGPDGQPIAPGQYVPGQPLPGQPLPGQPYTGVQAQPYPGTPGFQGQTGGMPFPGAQIPGQAQPGQVQPGQVQPGQVQPGRFPGVPGFPGQLPGALPGQVLPGQPGAQPFPGVQAQPFNGGQTNPGSPVPSEFNNPGGFNPTQQVPGRTGIGTAGGTTPPGQSSSSSPSYVGAGQSYVGSSQPYVGGGGYVGAQPSAPMPGQTPPPTGFAGNPGNQVTGPSPVSPFGAPNFPGVPPTPQPSNPSPSVPGAQFPNPGAGIIGGLLTTPNPAAGAPQTSGQPIGQPLGQQIGGGIAGIASKSEDPSIMVYNDRTNYNEWEFIYDYSKQQPLGNAAGTTIGTPAATLGTTGSSFGTPASAFGTPAGGLGGGPGTLPGGSPGLTGGFGAGGFGAPTGPGAGPAAGLPGQTAGTPGQQTPAGQQPGVGGAQNQKQQLPTSMRPGRK